MIIINPGSGPVGEKSTMENAYRNIEALLKEAGLPPKYSRDMEAREDDGRFAFVVPIAGQDVSVLMPGIPLKKLKDERYIHVPRLYVGGSSWWWKFAVSVLRDWESDQSEGSDK